MTTSPTTFDAGVRAALLDVLHAQWREFGVSFSPTLPEAVLEVIDPEALLWCSLEFSPSEPRLAEGVNTWVAANRTRINRQRLNKLVHSEATDERAQRLNGLDARRPELASRSARRAVAKPLGDQSSGASTLLLRSRDVLGNDCRSFLIVHLIGSPRGVRLRDVAASTRYTYRSVFEAATGWERAGVVHIQHGHCVLANPAPWCELLECRATEVVMVDWHAAYQAAIDLIRTLAKARSHDFASEHPLVRSAIRTADAALDAAAPGVERSQTPAFARLRAALQRA